MLISRASNKSPQSLVVQRVYGDLSVRCSQLLSTGIASAHIIRPKLKGLCYLDIQGIGTHSFRKFYATEIYKDSGYNILLVQQLLQHSSSSVSQAYIGIRQKEIETAIEGHLKLDV